MSIIMEELPYSLTTIGIKHEHCTHKHLYFICGNLRNLWINFSVGRFAHGDEFFGCRGMDTDGGVEYCLGCAGL